MMQHLRTSAMIAAFVLGYLCPWASALNGLIRWLIVIMMFLVFLQVRVSWRTLRLGHLNILLANIGIGMGSWFLCRIFGSSELAMAAFFTGITPTATAAAVIVHLLGGRVEYAVSAFLTTNLGMALLLPFLIPAGDLPFVNGDYLFFPEIRKAVEEKADVIKAYVVKDGALVPFEMTLGALTDDEREIIRKGCLINYYRG